MGTYLSTPVTEKCVESGESPADQPWHLCWSVVDMQGWRKSMEDAHVAQTNVSVSQLLNDGGGGESSSTIKVFGVFDGHGGPEVARFCSLYLVSVLKQQIRQIQRDESTDELSENSSNPKQSLMGNALVKSFHALDRMIDDENRRHELVELRTWKPTAGLTKEAQFIPPPIDPSTLNGGPSHPNKDVVALADRADDESRMSSDSMREADDDENSEDSNEVAGKEEAAQLDQNLDTDEEEEPAAPDDTTGRVTAMFQRLLTLSGQAAGQGVMLLGGPSEEPTASSSALCDSGTFKASIEQNGRLICNLPDHPIHAGATAIVAVLSSADGLLTVANAGDSRAVLCRAHGEVLPLSFDHKPMQQVELARITKAGGFVNTFGRVNGNLNLSRSIGDLKYKSVPGILPSEQMITAEPDILQVQIDPTDEFIILGCDGIWDCMTNEKAVAYVRSRIDTQTAASIGREMLDEIISVDPRVTQGIGGDNMTVMVIDLQPEKRSYAGDEEALASSHPSAALEESVGTAGQ